MYPFVLGASYVNTVRCLLEAKFYKDFTKHKKGMSYVQAMFARLFETRHHRFSRGTFL